jgi:PAB-dependent poly(A)-specific ribonuclease subunit 3
MMLYDYHPACVTLLNKYLVNGNNAANAESNGAYVDPFSSDPDAPRPYTHQVNTARGPLSSTETELCEQYLEM